MMSAGNEESEKKIIGLKKKIEEYENMINKSEESKVQLTNIIDNYFETDPGAVKKEVKKIEKNIKKIGYQCGSGEYFDTKLRRCNKRFIA
jgi:hypothetical protein